MIKRTFFSVDISLGIRLVGGESQSEGTVELMVNGQWGTICDYNFDKHDADVICRMAGYSRYLRFILMSQFYFLPAFERVCME